MNEQEDSRQVMSVTVFKQELKFTEAAARALKSLQDCEGYIVVEMLAFVDTVVTNLALSGRYDPSDEGCAEAIRTASCMRDKLYALVNDTVYEKYQ